MRGQYATDTSVSVEKSRAEIESVLRKYGCDEFGYVTRPAMAMISFCLTSSEDKRLRIQMKLPLPPMKDFETVKGAYGKVLSRSPELQARMWEQACRSLWRALLLVIKAKLEAVTVGISTIEREFLADIVLPGGGTVGDSVMAQLPHLPSDGAGRLMLTGRVA